jgi:protein-S-isoprenylcysteine O-methyltransferase Ste14
VKVTQRLEPPASRVIRAVLFLTAVALLMFPRIPLPGLYWTIWPQGPLPFFIGAAITAAGLFFCIWARNHLGRNWSSSVTIKKDHELITTGPYSLVRHPIYTGILVGFLGSAIATSQIRGLLALILIFIALEAKLRLEERWMREQFGDSYEAYSHRVAGLVPFIL